MNVKTLLADLDNRIAFHENNRNDPHNIGNAVSVALREMRESVVAACDDEPATGTWTLSTQDLEDLVFGLKRMRLLEWHDKNDGDREKRLEALCKRFQVLLKEDK